MKKLYTVVITFIVLFSALLSQNRNLEMPTGSTKINIEIINLEEGDPVRENDILSKIKLRLRRNGIEYHITDDDDYSVGTLVIDILIVGDNDSYAGTLQLAFIRSNFLHIGDLTNLDITINEMLDMDKPNLMAIIAYQTPITVFSGTREHIIDTIDEYLNKSLDNFSTDYIDANNL
jgi:hypothetical protein